jgi:hypothetical protein
MHRLAGKMVTTSHYSLKGSSPQPLAADTGACVFGEIEHQELCLLGKEVISMAYFPTLLENPKKLYMFWV